MADDTTFRRWLRGRRKEFDLTQAELAEQVGCSVVTIRRIEEGVLRPSRQLTELLVAGLEVPLEERLAYVRWARSTNGVIPPGLLQLQHSTDPTGADSGTVASSSNSRYASASLPALQTRQPEPEIRNPYKGLRAFQEVDAPDFFGRDALT